MNNGFILLHRSLLENAIFYKPDYFQIWIYILLRVNHKENEFIWNGEKKIVDKGCGIFSQKKISEELNIAIGTVHNALKYLKSESQIEIKSTNKYTEIKVINWDKYQDLENIVENRMKARRKQNESNVKQTIHDKHDKHDNNKAMFVPPVENDVIKYFSENGYDTELAKRAFKYYAEADWKDSKGNQVKNWKQKMQAVWLKPENKKVVQKVNGQNGVIL